MPDKQDLVLKQEELKRLHGLAMEDVDDFSIFLNTWQSITEGSDLATMASDISLSNFEDYASFAVRDFLEAENAQKDGLAAASLGQHDCAACTITTNGVIRQINLKAHTREALVVGQTLAECGITFNVEEDISTLLARQDVASSTTYQLLQAQNTRLETYVTLALSKMPTTTDEDPLFLVLLISPPNTKVAIEMLGQKFSLTRSEVEITKSFLDGIPLRDIASNRGRSYTTIRNQFQSVLDKSGCASQTELFRLAFSFVQLAQQTGMNAKPTLRTDDRKMLLPRPKGRVVELHLCGDDMGRPLLSFPSLFGHGFTPALDAKLRARSIFLISISRPGFGETSPAPKDQGLYDCLAGDVRAALDSLEIDQCPAITRASASRSFCNLLAKLPDRISSGVIVNGVIPRHYIANKTIISKWTQALMSASIVSYPVAKLILGTGSRLFKRADGAAFIQKMYQNSTSDVAALSDPDVVMSMRQGAETTAYQGLTACSKDMVDGFCDWAGDLGALTTKITMYHGHDDPHVPFDGVQEFVHDNADYLTLVAEPHGGGQLFYSHVETVLDLAFQDDPTRFEIAANPLAPLD